MTRLGCKIAGIHSARNGQMYCFAFNISRSALELSVPFVRFLVSPLSSCFLPEEYPSKSTNDTQDEFRSVCWSVCGREIAKLCKILPLSNLYKHTCAVVISGIQAPDKYPTYSHAHDFADIQSHGCASGNQIRQPTNLFISVDHHITISR